MEKEKIEWVIYYQLLEMNYKIYKL
jgi:hypothetical protein